MTRQSVEPPKLTLPPKEAAYLRSHYERASTILEYGSGGSTWLGASLPGKYIMSVESDERWAADIREKIEQGGLPSAAIIWYVNVGPTGPWGRPIDDRAWKRFHLYPLSVWDQSFMRHPDVILIDGRFRAACFAAACLRISRPTTVLFDDYADRPRYHAVERIVRPVEMVGRMAVFHLKPGLIPPDQWTNVIGLFGQPL